MIGMTSILILHIFFRAIFDPFVAVLKQKILENAWTLPNRPSLLVVCPTRDDVPIDPKNHETWAHVPRDAYLKIPHDLLVDPAKCPVWYFTLGGILFFMNIQCKHIRI